MFEYNDYCCCPPRPCPPRPCPPRPCPPRPRPRPCCCEGPVGPRGPAGPRGATGPQGPTGPYLSSYVEANGGTQTVSNGGNIAFDTGGEEIDIVGGDITVSADGTVFTINRTGLYHLEWSLNIRSGEQPVLIGLMENDGATSVISDTTATGNHSSGALINVTRVPYTISLHNFGGQIALEDPAGFGDTAASIRILRFADGPAL